MRNKVVCILGISMKLVSVKSYPGVSYNRLKNGDKTYYITYKDENNISRRKKVGRLSQNTTAEDAFKILREIQKRKKREIRTQSFNSASLTALAELYFQQQITDRFGAIEYKFKQSQRFKETTLYEETNRIHNDSNSFNYGNHKIAKNSTKMINYHLEYLQELQAFYPPMARKIQNYRKTILKYKANAGRHHTWMYTALNKITKKDINFFVSSLLSSGKSRKTISDVLSLLRTIVNWAIDNDFYTENNPFIGYKFSAPKKQRERFLTHEEIDILLDRMQQENKNIYLCTYLGLITAGRANTVLNIQKKDINFSEKTITLINFKAKNRKYKIPLDDSSINYLKEITKDLDRNDYLIQPSRKKDYKQRPLYKIPPKFYEVCDELFNSNIDKQIEPENIVNYHTLRHTVASLMAIEGESIYKIKYILDHSNIEETERYAKLRPNDMDKMIHTYVANHISVASKR